MVPLLCDSYTSCSHACTGVCATRNKRQYGSVYVKGGQHHMRMPTLQGYTSQACLGRRAHQKNDDCTRPMVAVSQPNCLDIGRIAMLMFTRSMLHSMNATKHSPTIVKRRCHPERCTASTT